MPAILKGWVDRLYSYCFAYGVVEHSDKRWGDRYGEGRLAGRRAMLIVIAGGWESHYGPRGINGPIDDVLFPINHRVLFYPSLEVLPPFVVHQAGRMNDGSFSSTADALRDRMRGPFTASPIPYRRRNGGDDAIPSMELRAEVAGPDLTGFAAHVSPVS